MLCELMKNDPEILTPDLLKPYWRSINHKSGVHTTGHCYAASEALFYLLGGTVNSKYKPRRIKMPEGNHWYLQHEITNEILDPTSTQFPFVIDYEKGKGCGFMKQSKRSKTIIERVKERLGKTQLG